MWWFITAALAGELCAPFDLDRVTREVNDLYRDARQVEAEQLVRGARENLVCASGADPGDLLEFWMNGALVFKRDQPDLAREWVLQAARMSLAGAVPELTDVELLAWLDEARIQLSTQATRVEAGGAVEVDGRWYEAGEISLSGGPHLARCMTQPAWDWVDVQAGTELCPRAKPQWGLLGAGAAAVGLGTLAVATAPSYAYAYSTPGMDGYQDPSTKSILRAGNYGGPILIGVGTGLLVAAGVLPRH